MITLNSISKQVVHVAVAVIRYQDEFLLGYRSRHQHQGELFEFVGGKIEAGETATDALCREVLEETGLDIYQNKLLKLGRIWHDYADKSVCLHVFQISLSNTQFEKYRQKSHGLENQPLIWASKTELLAQKFPLPKANMTILAWLSLPDCLAVTLPVTEFEPPFDWLDYHQTAIPKHAWVYVRPKASLEGQGAVSDVELSKQLISQRSDIKVILPVSVAQKLDDSSQMLPQLMAGHLSQSELLAPDFGGLKLTKFNHPLVVSCHDDQSIKAANTLAKLRLSQQLPPVLAILLAPVLPTMSHPNEPALGWQAWSDLAALADVPVIALGGLSPEQFDTAQGFGAMTISGIRQFLEKIERC